MNKDERELLELKFNDLKDKIIDNHELEMIELKRINGRLGLVEKETKIVRFLETHPIVTVLIVIGLVVIYSTVGINEIIKIIR